MWTSPIFCSCERIAKDIIIHGISLHSSFNVVKIRLQNFLTELRKTKWSILVTFSYIENATSFYQTYQFWGGNSLSKFHWKWILKDKIKENKSVKIKMKIIVTWSWRLSVRALSVKSWFKRNSAWDLRISTKSWFVCWY